MAKKLIYDYTIDAASNKISVKGNHRIETLLIITDITAGKILYKFANADFGFSSSTFNTATGFTDIILVQDLDAIGVTNSDKLQVFFEDENIFIEPSQSLVDPVHKLRVSNPENLIDTDFEYGLQSTKWETIELVNNVPSIYTSAANTIQAISSVTSQASSDVITVSTDADHGLVIGTPIDVQGLDSATAEGKYIIKAIPTSQSFTYQCRSVQSSSATISGIYTTIIPGEFYTSAEISYNQSSGFVTDQANQSKLIITTLYDHGFSSGTQFYLLNTLGSKSLQIADPTATASDGFKFSEFGSTADVTLNPLAQSSCIIRRASGPIVLRFGASDITGGGNLTITGHGLKSNDYVQYNPSGNDIAFNGLDRFQIYIVKWISANEIQLSTDLDSPASATAPGGSYVTVSEGSGTTAYGDHSLHLVYAISRLRISNNYLNHYYPHAYTKSTTGANGPASGEYSGWQLKQTSNYGRGGSDAIKHMVLLDTGRLNSTKSATFPGHPHRINWVGSYGPQFMLPVNGMYYETFYFPYVSIVGKGSGTWYLKIDMRDAAYNDWIGVAPTNATLSSSFSLNFGNALGRGLMGSGNTNDLLINQYYNDPNTSASSTAFYIDNYNAGDDDEYERIGNANSTASLANWNSNMKPYQYIKLTSAKADTLVDGMPYDENWNFILYARVDWANSYSSWDAGEENVNKWHIYPEGSSRTDGQPEREPGYFNYYNDPRSVGSQKINATFTHYSGTGNGYLRAYSNSYRDTSPDWYNQGTTSDNYDSGLFAIPIFDESDFLNIYWPNHGLETDDEVHIFNLDNQIVLEDATGSAGDRMLLDGTDGSSTNAGDCIDVEEGISTNIRTYGADWFNNHNYFKDQFTTNYEAAPVTSHTAWYQSSSRAGQADFQGTPHHKRFRGARLNIGGQGTAMSDPLVIDGDSFEHTGAQMRLGSGNYFLETGVSTHFEYEIPSGGVLYAEVVNTNYIRLLNTQGGEYTRLKSFGKSDTGGAGVYKLVGKKQATTQGSFFIEGHNLSENASITFNNSGGGAYPATQSQDVYFNEFNSWASSLLVNTVTDNWDHDGTHSNINIYDASTSTSGQNYYMNDGVGDLWGGTTYYTWFQYYTGSVTVYGGNAMWRQGNAVFNPWLSSLPNARGYGTASNYNEFMGTRTSTTSANYQDLKDGLYSGLKFQGGFPAKVKYGANAYQLAAAQKNLWHLYVVEPKNTQMSASSSNYLHIRYNMRFGTGKLYPGTTATGDPTYQGNEQYGTYNYGCYPAYTGNSSTGWFSTTNGYTDVMQSGSIDDVQFVLEPGTTSWTTDAPDYLILDSTNGSADAGDNILHEDIELGNWRFASWASQSWGGTDNTGIVAHIGIDSPTNIGTTSVGDTGLGISRFQQYRYYSTWRGTLRHLTQSSTHGTTIRGSNFIFLQGLMTHNSGVRVSDGQIKGVIVQVMQDFMDKVKYVADGFDNTTTYYANVLDSNRFRLKTATDGNAILTTNSGSNEFTFESDTATAAELGTNDGAYTTSSIPSSTSLEISVPYQIKQRQIDFTSATFDSASGLFTYLNHGLFDGAPLIYSNNGNSDATNLSNAVTYYAYIGNQDTFGVRASTNDAVNIAVSGITGTHIFTTNNVAGRGEGAGTINVDANTKTIIGTGTFFRRYYLPGDTFEVEDATTSPSQLKTLTVDSISSDTEMKIVDLPAFSSATAKYFVTTKIYTRPSGSFIHRPFDGGVEIKAGSSPNSVITRQTRKYFRYQSGKGIQCSLAINFNPPVLVRTLQSAGSSTCTVKTQYPHGITQGCSFRIEGVSNDSTYNGTFTVASVTDDFIFTYVAGGTPSAVTAQGNIQFHAKSWSGAQVRGGMFDYQNGFFYEFDGTHMYCVRRSSTLQISGTATVTLGSGVISGTDTSWTSTLAVGDMTVIRGQSYKIVKITNNSSINVQPAYRGTSASGVIVTKTVDTKVRQDAWSVDPCDGTGKFGFNLDVDKIQMAYFDYSWYGAGKIRFGFKDQNGQVKYVHDFKHNNLLTEAYFRSGNLPGRYEIENTGSPTFIPNLFHWGTSIIMDGTFNDDEAYLFTANSNTLTSTNGQSNTSTTNATSSITYQNYSMGYADFFLRLPFPSADASKLQPGTTLYSNLDETGGSAGQNAANLTENNRINTILQGYPDGNIISSTQYSGSTIYALVYAGNYNYFAWKRGGSPTNPNIGSSSPFSLGADVAGAGGTGFEIDLATDTPLVSIRLAPSVDSGISGSVGTREIINRMQLKLRQIGIVTTHDTEVSLILNGNLNNTSWSKANSPSLSQYIPHNAGDVIDSGSKIYTFRASGGQQIGSSFQSLATDFDISELTNLGNSILGGDRTFPDGPDVITITVKPIDTTNITAAGPFGVSGRLSWAESQA